ncbi:unnamed protein product [Pylaiella littoralis]
MQGSRYVALVPTSKVRHSYPSPSSMTCLSDAQQRRNPRRPERSSLPPRRSPTHQHRWRHPTGGDTPLLRQPIAQRGPYSSAHLSG